MGRYTFTIHVDAPPEVVFDLWTNLDRAPEWIGGLKKVTDVTGPVDQAGTRYTAWFGGTASPTEVIDAERPERFATRFGNTFLRGTNTTTFAPEGGGTTVTQELATNGFIAGIMGWIFAHGSYAGSFRGELEHFGRLAEADGRSKAR